MIDTRAGFGYDAVGNARVAELVDARDLKSLGVIHHAGSIPAPGTNNFNNLSHFLPLQKGRFFSCLDRFVTCFFLFGVYT